METLVLNGKSYVKASKAAQDLGYTSDYVGQLCRGGSVDAHLVGRTWYVNPETLKVHRVEKKRNARLKAREYAKKAIEESRSLSVNKTKNTYRNIPIRYEGDKSELIPSMRKLAVDAKEVTQTSVVADPKDSAPYIFENENKKIIMSGKLIIQDADTDVVQNDTVILSPTFRKRHHEVTASKGGPVSVGGETTVSEIQKLQTTQKSFADKIKDYQNTESVSIEKVPQVPFVDGAKAEVKLEQIESQPAGWARYVAGPIAVLVISLLSIYLEQQVVWENQSVSTNYSFDFEEEINIGL